MQNVPQMIRFSGRTWLLTLSLFSVVLNFGCSTASEPEQIAKKYVVAIREGRCSDARQLLSERTNYALEYIRKHPPEPRNPLPIEEYYCGRFAFEDCKLSKVQLERLEQDTATVTISCGKTQDGFLPGWSSMFLKYEPRPIELVREAEEWKIVETYVNRFAEVREREEELREEAMRPYEQQKRERMANATKSQ